MYMDSGSGTQSDSYFSAVEQHRDYYSQSSSFVEKPVASGAAGPNCRWEVAPGAGEGSSEMFSLHSGLNVGVCGYLLNEPMEGLYMRRCKSLTVCAMLSGKFELSSTDKRRSEVVGRGDVWISAGEDGEARCVEPSGEFISGVGVELPGTMLDAWFGAASCELTRSLEQTLEEREKCGGHVLKGAFPKVRSLPDSHPLIMSAKRLLMIERDTVCGRLAFESCALDFLSQALMLNTPVNGEYPMGSSRKKAVEEAVCILNDEWGTPPTITALSRRIGINECYLKNDFRQQTGMTIGEYVRKLRMERALELIESGRFSVLQTAMFVGYSNPSHFSKAFKRFHGRLPSTCLSRA